MQDVIAAMATAPWSRVTWVPSARVAATGLEARSPRSPTLLLVGLSDALYRRMVDIVVHVARHKKIQPSIPVIVAEGGARVRPDEDRPGVSNAFRKTFGIRRGNLEVFGRDAIGQRDGLGQRT